MFLQLDQFNSEVKRSEVKICGGSCVLSWTGSCVLCMWVPVQYVLLLSHCLIAICFMSFVLCYVVINCFMCFHLFVLCSFSYFVCFTFYFVSSVFLHFLCIVSPQYIIVYFLFVYNYTDHCHRVEIQLQLIKIVVITEWEGHVVRVKAEGTRILLENLTGYLTLIGG
jgi:hypothetical protein